MLLLAMDGKSLKGINMWELHTDEIAASVTLLTASLDKKGDTAY